MSCARPSIGMTPTLKQNQFFFKSESIAAQMWWCGRARPSYLY